MTLAEVIARLEREPLDMVVTNGFGGADSWRGDYSCIAFAPATNTTVRAMLESARNCVGRSMAGYKGGTYRMTLDTECCVAEWGEYGGDSDRLFPERLDAMLGALVPRAEVDALRARVAEVEAERDKATIRAHLVDVAAEHESAFNLTALAASQAEARELREALTLAWRYYLTDTPMTANEMRLADVMKAALGSRPPGDDTALREVLTEAVAAAKLEGMKGQQYVTGGYGVSESDLCSDESIINRILGQPGDDAKEGQP